jgi:hypothetical protein
MDSDSISTIEEDHCELRQYIKKRRLEKNKYSSPKITKQSKKFDQIFNVNDNMTYDKTMTGLDTIDLTKKTDFLPIYDVKGTSTSLLLTNDEEMKIRETFKNVWKSSSASNGGYSIANSIPILSSYCGCIKQQWATPDLYQSQNIC